MSNSNNFAILQQHWKIIKDAMNNKNNSPSKIWSTSNLPSILNAFQDLQNLFDKTPARSVINITTEICSIANSNPQTILVNDRCVDLVNFVVETVLSLEKALFSLILPEVNGNNQDDDDEMASGMMTMDESSGYTTLDLALEEARDVLEDFMIPVSSPNNNNDGGQNWTEYFNTMSGLRSRDFEEAKRRVKSIMPIVRTSLGLFLEHENNNNGETPSSNCTDGIEQDKRQEAIDKLRQKLRERYEEEFFEMYGTKAVKLGSVFVTLRIQNASSNNNNAAATTTSSSAASTTNLINNNNLQQKQRSGIISESEGEIVSGNCLPDRVSQVMHGNKNNGDNNHKSVVVLEGPAGVGKTSLGKQLCIEQGFKDALLIFVPLKNLHGIKIEDASTLLSCCASNVLRGDEMDMICPKDKGNNNFNVDQQPQSPIPVMWFLDGFDEVQNTTDSNLSYFLKHFVDPRSRALHVGDSKFKNFIRDCDLVVVSSREERTENAKSGCNLDVGNVEKWVIMRWSDAEVRQYCSKWFSNVLSSNTNNNCNNSTDVSGAASTTSSSSSSSNNASKTHANNCLAITSSSSSSPTSNKIESATEDVVRALSTNHMEYFAGLPLIVHMLCEIKLERGDLSRITPSAAFEEMTLLHWNRARKRIKDRLVRLGKEQQTEILEEIFATRTTKPPTSSKKMTSLTSVFSDEGLEDECFRLLYAMVISRAAQAGYQQLVDSTKEDVTSLVFLEANEKNKNDKNKNCHTIIADLGGSNPNNNKLPMWATLLRETGLLRFSSVEGEIFQSSNNTNNNNSIITSAVGKRIRRGRFPHRSYIEFLCARYAFSHPSISLNQSEDADAIQWTPKFATVWLLLADFVMTPNSASNNNNKNRLSVVTLEQLASHIALLYTRTYERLVDRKNTSTTESNITFATAELAGVPLLLRLSMIFANNNNNTASANHCSSETNPGVDLLFTAIKKKHGLHGLTLRMPRHFLWAAEYSGSVGAIDAFKWIRNTYGSDVINSDIASAALSRALDKQDRRCVANFVKTLLDPPYCVPVTLASAVKVGSLAGVTRALSEEVNRQKHAPVQAFRKKRCVLAQTRDAFRRVDNNINNNNNNNCVVCEVAINACSTLKTACDRLNVPINPFCCVAIEVDQEQKVKWRSYLGRCLKNNWHDVVAAMLRLRAEEWRGITLYHHCHVLLTYILREIIPQEIQVWDPFLHVAVPKRKDDVLISQLLLGENDPVKLITMKNNSNNAPDEMVSEPNSFSNITQNPQELVFNCDDTSTTNESDEILAPTDKNFATTVFNRAMDGKPEYDSANIFLNNTNGWLSIISALLLHSATSSSKHHHNHRGQASHSLCNENNLDASSDSLSSSFSPHNNNNNNNNNICSPIKKLLSKQNPESITKIELVPKTVVLKSEFLQQKSDDDSSAANDNNGNNNNNIPPVLIDENVWRENLMLEDPSFEVVDETFVESSSSSTSEQKQTKTTSILPALFLRDVRVRRLTFSCSNASSSPFSTSLHSHQNLLRHFDISHIDAHSALQAGIDDTFVSTIFKNSPLLEHVDVSFTCGIISDCGMKDLFAPSTGSFAKKALLKYLNISGTEGAITDEVFLSSKSKNPSCFTQLETFNCASCKAKITDEVLIFIIRQQKQENGRLILANIDCRVPSGTITNAFLLEYVNACLIDNNNSNNNNNNNSNNNQGFVAQHKEILHQHLASHQSPKNSNNSNDNKNAKAESSILKYECPLKSLSVARGFIFGFTAFAVARAFMDAAGSRINDEGLVPLLRISDKLEHLDVSFTSMQVTNESIGAIISTKLKYLDVTGTAGKITDSSLEALFQKSTQLETLRCAWDASGITDVCLKAIAENEQSRNSLTSLDISWSTGFSDFGIANYVTQFKKLKYLNVKSNGGKISNNGMIALANAGLKDLRILNALLTAGTISAEKILPLFKKTNPLACVKISVADSEMEVPLV